MSGDTEGPEGASECDSDDSIIEHKFREIVFILLKSTKEGGRGEPENKP